VHILPTVFWCDLQNNGFHWFFCKHWAPYLKSDNVGHHFCPDFQRFCLDIWEFCSDFQGFSQIFRDFAQSFRDFAKIFNKSKLLGVRLHSRTPPPTPLRRPVCKRWACLVLTTRDGHGERGALGHLNVWGPTQVWPIWPFVWKPWKYAPLLGSAPSKIYLLRFRLWFYDCLRSSTFQRSSQEQIKVRSFLGIYSTFV